MSTTYTIAQDLKEAVSMTDGLQDYIRGTELYGNSGGGFFANMPSLTVGALVMRLRRLEVLRNQLNASQQAQLDKTSATFKTIEKEWNVHFSEKIVKEAHSRLDAMKAFFQECAQNSKSCAGNYPPEVLRRTIVQELWVFIANNRVESPELKDKLILTDGKLRSLIRPSDFIWASPLQVAYSQADYWWLYQRPPQD